MFNRKLTCFSSILGLWALNGGLVIGSMDFAIAADTVSSSIAQKKRPSLDSNEWQLVSWTGGNPLATAPITAQFEDNRLSGSDGCNRYNSSYQLQNKTLRINPTFATTRRACPPEIMEKGRQFLNLLGKATQYLLTDKGMLLISYQDGNQKGVLTFSPKAIVTNPTPAPSLEGKEWTLTSLNGTPPIKDKLITALFKEGRLGGSGGCNRYTTSYKLQDKRLTIDKQIASTMMACPPPLMTQESLFLTALAGAKDYKIDAQGKLQISYQTGDEKGILTFSASPSAPRSEAKPVVKAQKKIIYVNDRTVNCTGVAPQKCWQIKENPDDKWQLLYTPIAGFAYQPGFLYKLSITETPIANPPADGSSIQRKLVNVMAKVPAIWLDRPLATWNQPGAKLPKAPKPSGDRPTVDRCRAQVRSPMTVEDNAIAKAGWSLFGAVQTYGKTSVIQAMTSVDGMCRPLGYQAFVFQGGKFAGTLSPQTMDSRTNGAIQQVYLTDANNLTVTYNRYGEKDPLCCPSLVSNVTFKIDQKQGKPLVIPVNSSTGSAN